MTHDSESNTCCHANRYGLEYFHYIILSALYKDFYLKELIKKGFEIMLNIYTIFIIFNLNIIHIFI